MQRQKKLILKSRVSGEKSLMFLLFGQCTIEPATLEMWNHYTDDLRVLLTKMQAGQRREARGELARRVGEVFQGLSGNVNSAYTRSI